ncbi:hypothetical protein HZH66_007039 [Vespula vulgaris]|uniref:Uncharacterized protein n=2 Tax=Vespula TaxID=7451 RepID=A0A834P0I3_VESPE|nr:hypothetical protein HZH66_007039 [Vespula vulgaris]KAF7423147.1 hypothetical protein H0235_008430 [Vespula pensylvanica]
MCTNHVRTTNQVSGDSPQSGVAGARLTPDATTAADGTGSLSGSGSTTGTGTGTASASALALAPLRYACAAPDPAKPRPGV